MKFGTCCSPQTLGWSEASFDRSAFLESIGKLRDAGAEYLEFPVVAVAPEGEAREWENLLEAIQNAPLKIEAFNGFIPGHHRITGPEVHLENVLEFCRVALNRCRALGGESVVLGSGAARKVPDGFDMEIAQKQFVEFCRELGPIAAENQITICIEPLNTQEDNLIISVQHGAQIVDEVSHPNIQLLADFFHIMKEDEPLQNIVDAGARLRHTHLAERDRTAPGFSPAGEADYVGFFKALHQAGYDSSTPDSAHVARCSFEGSAPDLFHQAAPMFALLRRRYEEAVA